jgi:hypothetical protein
MISYDIDTQHSNDLRTQADCDPAAWRNELTPELVDAIAKFIAGTPDPCAVTDALEAALLAGGMTHNQISLAVDKFLPKTKAR